VPELPEVETIVRALAPRLRGRRIVSAEFRCLRVLHGDPDKTAAALAGRKVLAVRRHGKFIEMQLDGGHSFVVHLGMTGKLLMNGTPGRHTHAILTLDRGALLYDDSRQFGRLELSAGLPARVRKLGPEPLEVTLEEFVLRVHGRKTKIKALLLNQRFLRGIGNIYADEALFRAQIHPQAIARRLAAMAENAANVVAIELIAAAQGCDFHAPMTSSTPLERVRALIRERVPRLEHDRYLAPDIASAAELVRSGALAATTEVALPNLEGTRT